MATHTGDTFVDSDVVLDGNEYRNCVFQNCRLIFRGQKLPTLNGNTIGNSHFVFEGPAQVTVAFLQAMANPNSGLSEVVKRSFPELPVTLRQKTADRDPVGWHAVMLRRMAAIEETIARLPAETTPGMGHNQPPPLTDSEIEEIKRDIAMLKALPPVPAQPPTEASAAVGRLKSLVGKFGDYAVKQADNFVTEGVKTAAKTVPIWALFHDQLAGLIQSIINWLAALTP